MALGSLETFSHTKRTLTLIFLVTPHVCTGIFFIVNIATVYLCIKSNLLLRAYVHVELCVPFRAFPGQNEMTDFWLGHFFCHRVMAYSRPTTWPSTTVAKPSGRSVCWGHRQRETPSSGLLRWCLPGTSEPLLPGFTSGSYTRERSRAPLPSLPVQVRVGHWRVRDHGSLVWMDLWSWFWF